MHWYIITYIKYRIPRETLRLWDFWDFLVKTFPTTIHSPTSRLRQASQLCSCKSSKYKDMRHGKCGPQGDGKREGKERKVSQVSHCLIKWIINVIKKIILIYNNLYKTVNSTWDSETVRHLRHFCKDFSNGYTFSNKQTTTSFTTLFL